MKCDLSSSQLEELHQLFSKINQSKAEIKTGAAAQENYIDIINELTALTADDSEYGEELCRKALEQLSLVKAAEMAQVSIATCRAELETKYEIPGGKCGTQETRICPSRR